MAIVTREKRDGTLVGVDDATGEVVWTQAKKAKPQRLTEQKKRPLAHKTGGCRSKGVRTLETVEGPIQVHDVLDGDGRLRTVPVGIDPSKLPKTSWVENQVTKDLILEKVLEGLTIEEIGAIKGFPSRQTIARWADKNNDPVFHQAMKDARKERAEHFHDKAILTAKNTVDPEQVPVSKLQVETYKWASKVGDPDTYGDKMKHSGDPEAPVGFIISTGVPQREEKPEIELPNSPSLYSEPHTKEEGQQ